MLSSNHLAFLRKYLLNNIDKNGENRLDKLFISFVGILEKPGPLDSESSIISSLTSPLSVKENENDFGFINPFEISISKRSLQTTIDVNVRFNLYARKK